MQSLAGLSPGFPPAFRGKMPHGWCVGLHGGLTSAKAEGPAVQCCHLQTHCEQSCPPADTLLVIAKLGCACCSWSALLTKGPHQSIAARCALLKYTRATLSILHSIRALALLLHCCMQSPQHACMADTHPRRICSSTVQAGASSSRGGR